MTARPLSLLAALAVGVWTPPSPAQPAAVVSLTERRRAGEFVRPARGGDDLAGRRIVITAGGTREPLDPVRFLGNRSSGRQGIALAVAAKARGAGSIERISTSAVRKRLEAIGCQ